MTIPEMQRVGIDNYMKLMKTRMLFWGSLLAPAILLLNIFHRAPDFHLDRVYVPGLDKSSNSSTNSSILFDISFNKELMIYNIYFDLINITFYNGPDLNHSVASVTVKKFYMARLGRDVTSRSLIANATGLDFDAAKQEIAAHGFKAFRMKLKTSVRFSTFVFWKTGRKAYEKSADVKIGDTGAATESGNGFVGARFLFMLNLVVAVFLCSF